MSTEPNGELPPVDPELFELAREAVSAIRGRGRNADGTAAVGNTLRLSHGLRSRQLLQQSDISAWHVEQVAAIETDLGGEQELSTLQRGMVRETARVEVILASLGDELLTGGVLTGKGKARAHTTLYLKTLDRYANLCKTLGMARRPKPTGSLEDITARISARKAQEPAR